MNFNSAFETIRKCKPVRIFRLSLFLFVASSCVGVKYLKEDEVLLNKVSIKGAGGTVTPDLETLYRQEPNTRFLMGAGPAHLAILYQIGRKNFLFHYDTSKIARKRAHIKEKYDRRIDKAKREQKEKRLINKQARKLAKKDRALEEGNQLMRWGEPLAVYDSSKTHETVQQMKQYLNAVGFYANKVTYEEKLKGKNERRVNLTYQVEQGPPYVIDSLQFVVADPKVRDLFMSQIEDMTLKKGRRIRQAELAGERERVYNQMVNNGYYAFSKDYVRFEIDSVSLEPTHLIVRQIITNPPESHGHKQYTIDSVVFVTDAGAQISKGHPDEHFRKVTYTYGRFKYSPKILDWHNQLYPRKMYQRDNVLKTQRQLATLDIYKFINVNFDTLGGRFIAHVFTSPAEKFQSSTELGFSTLSQGLPGPFASLIIKNRNLFRGLEITEINTNFKIQDQGGVSQDIRTYSSIQYGSELSITFPQFLSPLGKWYKKKIAEFNPRTRFSLAFNREERLGEYTRTNFNTGMSYFWKVNERVSYTLNPMQVSYINANLQPSFNDFLNELEAQGNTYGNTFRSSFVSSGSFQLTLNNNYGGRKDASLMMFYVETGGHLLSLLGENPWGDQLQYFKYTKTQLDYRQQYEIHRKLSLAARFNLGLGLPYGANEALPYEKYFFAGGSNSIRAWRPRRLGPGAYGTFDTSGAVDYTLERPGDMILEMGLELRQKMTDMVHLGFFLDAGNTWLLRSSTVDPSQDPEGDDGQFRFNSFSRELALGGGYGVRLDLSFLIFRVDFGYKLIDPAQPPGQRWVGWDNDIIDFAPFRFQPFKNAQINIGIGYPF